MKAKRFTGLVKIVLDLGVDINAENMEDALAKARKWRVTDILDLSAVDHDDSSIEVTGICQRS